MMEVQSGIPLEKTLIPALMQCFGIIFLGYILGKVKILRQNEARGLSIFVQYLALPALIFSSVSTIPFTKIKWEFVAAVFVTKAFIFICVALISIITTHPLHLGKAGMYAIAATQSNDFALGYPLLVSLYQTTNPEYAMYPYIIAPIQLLLLNGIGFFLLEVESQNQLGSRWSDCHLFHILKNIFKNPVVVMTLFGLIWNVTYGEEVLPILNDMLKAFSSAFPATALLLLGYTMSLNNENFSYISLSVALIIFAKNLILPIILQKVSAFMLQNSSSKEMQSYSSFGFLYGTIPTAPTVYVFATHYDSCVNVIAKTVIGSTLLSAPIMFSSASVISLAQIGQGNISFYLSQTIGYLSVVNTICCIWLLILLCLGKHWRSISFGVIIYLVFAQFITAFGGLMLLFSPAKRTVLFYLQYVFTSGSIYATRMCTVLLASLLLIIRMRSLCFVLQLKRSINCMSIVFCFLLPYAVAACLILQNGSDTYGPSYQLGYIQVVTTFVITISALAGTVLCLILQRVYSKKSQTKIKLSGAYCGNSGLSDDSNLIPSTCTGIENMSKNVCCDIEDLGKSLGNEDSLENQQINSIENSICDSQYSCSIAKRFDCATQVSSYINENQEIGTGINDDEHFLKHIGLLIALIIAMVLSLSVCFWKLVMEDINGIFIELEFLDAIVNYSLGILFFIMFGFDRNLINIIGTKWTSCLTRLLPSEETISSTQQNASEEFIAHYHEKCKRTISETKFINNFEYHNIFEAETFIQWLLKENIVETTEEAENYIRHLLIDHILEKVYERNDFSKNLHLFRFTEINSS